MYIYQRQKAYISQTIKIQEHARADHIWSSPLKERNTEDSLNHTPPPPPPNADTPMHCLAFLALLLLHCSTHVTFDMTPMFLPPYTC